MTKYEEYTRALTGSRERPAVVVFTAQWCGPCKLLKPAMRQVRIDYGFDCHEFDVEDFSPEELQTLGVRNVPCVRVLQNTAAKAQFVGARTPRQIEDWLMANGVIARGLSFE